MAQTKGGPQLPRLLGPEGYQLRSEEGRERRHHRSQRLGQETRNKLTDYWATHEIKKEDEYAILTNIIHQEWSGVSVKAHKNLKDLKTQNLRDHMSEAELILTALAELSPGQKSV